MSKSKLVRFEPKMIKGQQRSWVNRDGKTNYTFNVQFENGDKGEADKQTTNPDWTIGTEYVYKYEQKVYDWGSIWKVTAMKDPIKEAERQSGTAGKSGGKGGGRGGYKMSEEEQKEIMMQVCMIAANDTMNKLSEDYNTIITKYMNWLMQYCFGGEFKAIGVQGILKITAHYFYELPEAELTIDQVLDRATKSLTALKTARTWKKVSPQVSNSENSEKKVNPEPSQEQASQQSEQISPSQMPEEKDDKQPFMKIE